jgi:hypothetical protein
LGGFRTPAPPPRHTGAKGRRSKPFTNAVVFVRVH